MMMLTSSKTIRITRTKGAGIPAFWVGGGAYTNACRFVTVLGARGGLKKPLFVRTRGQLSSRTDQALVTLREGDVIVSFSGLREELGAPHTEPEAFRVVKIEKEEAVVEKTTVSWSELPESVLRGAKPSQHSRMDGVIKNEN